MEHFLLQFVFVFKTNKTAFQEITNRYQHVYFNSSYIQDKK